MIDPIQEVTPAQIAISVLVPTYRRPVDLRRCLAAIADQKRAADTVVVVCRPDDRASHEVLAEWESIASLCIVHVHVPGVVAALNAGLATLSGDIVAITDDDAAPHTDWLERIEEHFRSDPHLGGLGGRDFVDGIDPQADTEQVGIITWFGRQVGNHHLGIGAPRRVDMLKGVNMSFRLAAVGDVRFDERLRGSGAQVHNELAFSLAIRRKGWGLVYDPAVAVDHFPAPRFDEDQRSAKSRLATSNSAYNETLTLLENLPTLSRPVFMLWAFLIGARDLPGVGQAVRLALKGDRDWTRFPAMLHGRFSALKNFFSPSTRAMRTPGP